MAMGKCDKKTTTTAMARIPSRPAMVPSRCVLVVLMSQSSSHINLVAKMLLFRVVKMRD
jgi:hypothetical protein